MIKINGTQAIIKSDEATFKRNTSALKVIGHIKPKTKPETDRSSFIQVRSTNPQSPVTQVGTGLDGPDLIDLMVVDPTFTDAVNQMRGSILDDINKRKSAHVDIELSLNELFDDEMHGASRDEEFDSAESEANASENEEEPGEKQALMVNERDQDGIFRARRSTRTKKPVEPFGHVVRVTRENTKLGKHHEILKLKYLSYLFLLYLNFVSFKIYFMFLLRSEIIKFVFFVSCGFDFKFSSEGM